MNKPVFAKGRLEGRGPCGGARGCLLSLVVGTTIWGGGAGLPEAQAQTVTVTQPLETQLLTFEQRDREQNRTEAREIILSWSVSGASGWSMRVTYCRDDVGNSPLDLVVNADVNGSNVDVASPRDGTYTLVISEDVLLDRALEGGAPCTGDQPAAQEGSLSIFVMLYSPGEDPDLIADGRRQAFTFEYDVLGPEAPRVSFVSAGRRSLEVSWDPSGSPDVALYDVEFCSISEEAFFNIATETLSEVEGIQDPDFAIEPAYAIDQTGDGWTCSDAELNPEGIKSERDISLISESIRLSDDIDDRDWVVFRMLGIDEAPFRNRTDVADATVYAVRTLPLVDFVDVYADQATGDAFEDGGFCYVATAAHGSYAHPIVVILRVFRDRVLSYLPFGRTLIRLYYHYSPPLADALRAHPGLAAVARAVLLMCVVLMGCFVALGSWLVFRLVARGVSRPGASGAAALMVMAGMAVPQTASAQFRGESDWLFGWAFEFKAGPYLPSLAEEELDPNGEPSAWSQIYGVDDTVTQFNLGLEMQLLRGAAGTVSTHGTIGFAWWGGRALLVPDGEDPSPGPTGSSTFNIIPLTLSVGYRFDYLMDHMKIPLAPYVRGGLAYNIWWNTRDDGSLSEGSNANGRYLGHGGTFGWVGTAGLALQLNFISPRNAEQLQEWTKIRATYIFFEGQMSVVDDFGGGGFDFSETTWFAGVSLEL